MTRENEITEKIESALTDIRGSWFQSGGLRSQLFSQEDRVLYKVKVAVANLKKLDREKRFSKDECSIIASFYRDLRPIGIQWNSIRIFRESFYGENFYRMKMLVKSRQPKQFVKCLGFFVWWIGNGFGVRKWRWFSWGALLILAFALLKRAVGEVLPFNEQLAQSVELFLQIAYPSEEVWTKVKVVSLAERICGMIYLGFGFDLLLSRQAVGFTAEPVPQKQS